MNVRIAACSFALVLASCGEEGRDTLLVASGFTDEIVQLRASDGAILARISIDPRPSETDEPHGLALAPDGRYWYATVSHGEPTLWKFERASNRLVGRVRLGTFGAGRIGITPDGETALVPDYYRDGGPTPSHVAVVRLHDLAVLGTPVVCPTPHDAAIGPDGRKAAVTCVASDEIVVLDPERGTELTRFPVDSAPGPPGQPRFRPMNAAWSPSGERLYVTLHASRLIRVFDPDGHPMGDVTTGAAPAQLAITADGRVLVAANRADGTASVIDTRALRERLRIPLGVAHPHGVAIAAGGGRAFISYEGDTQHLGGVVAIDLVRGEVIWRRDVGSFATGVIYLPDESG